MKHKRNFTQKRIEKALSLIEPLVVRKRHPIEAFRYCQRTDIEPAEASDSQVDHREWPVIEPQSYWGPWNTDFTLHSRFDVPADWHEEGAVRLSLKIGKIKNWDFCHPEALVCIDDQVICACDKFHQQVSIPRRFRDGNEHLLALHGYTGRWGHFDEPPAEKLFMGQCEVVLVDETARDFVALVRIALGAVRVVDQNDPARGHILNALEQAYDELDLHEPWDSNFYCSLLSALHVLRIELEKAGPCLDVSVTAIGHSHIDVAWLWTLAQTRQKCARSFSTVLALMDESREYCFTQSQPQLYDFVRQDYPELFEKIKERVAQGRWEATGGMWVEADCNITGSESLVRQFLLGRHFFAEHFGPDAETPILWLPDVFGCPYSLPQLIKQADLDYFFTTKLSWNQYNQMPYDTFWWQGIDGTRVLAHMGTTTPADQNTFVTYNGVATAEEIHNTWTHCRQKETLSDLMTVFGHGDGGGGPTREMLENICEMAEFPGLPETHHGRAIDFFQNVQETSADELPTWNGELYLELHRGTYTTQSRIKRANRKAEFAMHDTEWLAATASILDASFPYAHQPLREAWKLLCLNQFHDILPGSSIGEVYTESLQQFQRVRQIAADQRERALSSIARHTNGDLLVANPIAFQRNDLVLWTGALQPGQCLQLPDGRSALTQQTEAGTLIDLGCVDPLAIVPLKLQTAPSPEPQTTLDVSPRHLENALLRVEFNPHGDITSIFDKTCDREVLHDGGVGNAFQAFEDRPLDWDAWDIDTFYDSKQSIASPANSVKVVESGPLRATIEIRRNILHSPITQRISLSHNSQRIDFQTEIDWKEKHTLLKVAFPVAIHANQATYEIQWGNIERPTHRNTSWDWARFEVCAHKWIDLSEGDYGVSLLNDCKYGHDVKDNVMRITLLRSPTMPDPQADQGHHQFAYSLLPHAGGLGPRTTSAAYALNDPLIVHEAAKNTATEPIHPPEPIVQVDRDNIVIETIKRAEDNNGIIVRMYESLRQRGQTTITAGFPLREAYQTNLLEKNSQPLAVQDNSISLSMKPFEIITVRLIPA